MEKRITISDVQRIMEKHLRFFEIISSEEGNFGIWYITVNNKTDNKIEDYLVYPTGTICRK